MDIEVTVKYKIKTNFDNNDLKKLFGERGKSIIKRSDNRYSFGL